MSSLLRKGDSKEYGGPQYIFVGRSEQGMLSGFIYWFDGKEIQMHKKFKEIFESVKEKKLNQ